MPDSVRKVISKLAEEEIELHPGMREMNNAIDKMVGLNERMTSLLTNTDLSDKERKRQILELKSEFDAIIADLKKIEQRKDCSLSLKQFISDMEGQKKLCDMISVAPTKGTEKKSMKTRTTKE